jgi:transmembrane sensor
MNVSVASARTDAHRWFARLQAHDCSAEERATFARWYAADPGHAEAYEALEDLWDLTAELAQDDPAIASAVQEARAQPARRRSTRGRATHPRWLLLTAAAALGLAVFGLARLDSPTVGHYATAIGEQRTLSLADGSHVVLDTDTRLDVRFARGERHLLLQQGRAEFQVYEDPARPFVVQAGAAEVTATGTQFQVRLTSGQGEVTLREGQVRVASSQRTEVATLSPGERVTVTTAGGLEGVQSLSAAELAAAEGWTVGELVVQEWPLATLIAEMNRYGHTPLRLGDASVGRLLVSGTFDPSRPDDLALAPVNGCSTKKSSVVL